MLHSRRTIERRLPDEWEGRDPDAGWVRAAPAREARPSRGLLAVALLVAALALGAFV